MANQDCFSAVAAQYAAFRPDYPAELFDWLASVSRRRGLAWDCACGSGQASRPLASRFSAVVASDASMMQVATATASEAIWYTVATAHQAPLATGSVDLVTVAQALHWFVGEPFYEEVRRVLRAGGVFAAWTYGLPHFTAERLERSVHRFIEDRLGPYWLPEIRLVLDGYASIDLPCAEIEVPPFEMRAEWTLDRFLSFARTWSAVRSFVEARHEDPVDLLATEVEELCGDVDAPHTVSWKIKLRACRT